MDGAGLPPGVLAVCREIYQEGGLKVRLMRWWTRAGLFWQDGAPMSCLVSERPRSWVSRCG